MAGQVLVWSDLTVGDKRTPLTVSDGVTDYEIVRLRKRGFDLAADEDAGRLPDLRGRISVFKGAELVSTGLVMLDAVEDGLVRYSFKRLTPALAGPAADFAEETGILGSLEPA